MSIPSVFRNLKVIKERALYCQVVSDEKKYAKRAHFYDSMGSLIVLKVIVKVITGSINI